MGRKRIETQVKSQIVAYYKLNYHPNQIAALCNCSRGCVVNTIRNWKENGGVGDNSRSGRPRVSTEKEDRMLFKLARKNPRWSVRKRSTVKRRLLDFQLESYNETEKQLLSKEDKKKRLK
ncbi:Tc1-like transporase [Brachionus plicatilis]|uniref:Tc1-like transporase n=1 Tax=Brachionus plicatilis TaxID=10195 RepID=A0A3M7RUU6_BRAPC|nr:Tc1-like transporase [Brachionus plicatilis]